MVPEWGLSEKLGPLRYRANEEEVFLGHSVTQQKNVSDATAELIDQEIRRIIQEADGRARTVLTEHLDDLHKIANTLLEYETLSGEEVDALLKGEELARSAPDEPPKDAGRKSSVPSSGESDEAPDMTPTPQPES